jgi:hypothetical protein
MNKNILTGPNRYDKTLKPNLPSCQLWEKIYDQIFIQIYDCQQYFIWDCYTPAPRRGRGYTVLPLSVCPSFRPSVRPRYFSYDLIRQVERWQNHIKNRVDISRVYNWNGQYLTKANSSRCSPQKGVVFFNFIKFRSMWQLIYGARKQKGLKVKDVERDDKLPAWYSINIWSYIFPKLTWW